MLSSYPPTSPTCPWPSRFKPTKRPHLPRSTPSSSSSAGETSHLVLSPEGRTKLNVASDRDFYSFPRFVTHVDDGFIAALTDLYRERLRPGSRVLDLMSSWVSHLPPEIEFERVVGHGLNAQELAKNPRLDYFFVKDLNKEQELELELEDCSFDAVLCTVSVQYLQWPEKVFAEIFRVLKPGGVCIVSFSNRMFYEKAISAWRDGTSYSRIQLVTQYFLCVEGFTQPEVIRILSPQADKKSSSPLGMQNLGADKPDDGFKMTAFWAKLDQEDGRTKWQLFLRCDTGQIFLPKAERCWRWPRMSRTPRRCHMLYLIVQAFELI